MDNHASAEIDLPVDVWEVETEHWKVYWRDPNGRYWRSQGCSSLNEAIVRTTRHPWPWAIVREWHGTEVEERSRV